MTDTTVITSPCGCWYDLRDRRRLTRCQLHEITYRYPEPGWYALGRGGSAQARRDMQALEALGFRQVGFGRPPAGAEVVFGPTGTRNPGGPRSRTKWYVGRWYRPRFHHEEGTTTTIRTLNGTYTLTPDEEQLYRLGLWGRSNVRCGAPLPSLSGDGTCLRCGWQHAQRGPGAVERVAQARIRPQAEA